MNPLTNIHIRIVHPLICAFSTQEDDNDPIKKRSLEEEQTKSKKLNAVAADTINNSFKKRKEVVQDTCIEREKKKFQHMLAREKRVV